jgi:hypothetical protein
MKAMKNAYAISSLSRQMVKVCEQIDSLAMGVQDTEQGIGDLGDTYQELLLDELEHIQMLTLKLTELVSEAVGEETTNTDEGDGSSFAPGDLDAEKTGDVASEEGGEDDT